MPRQQRVDGRGQGVDVRGRCQTLLVELLLGRGPWWGGATELVLLDAQPNGRGDPEVAEHRTPDIGRLDIAVKVTDPVNGLHRARDLDSDLQGACEGQGLRGGQLAQVGRGTVLHDEVAALFLHRPGPVDRHDGGVR